MRVHTNAYESYLASPEWQLKRSERIRFARGICEYVSEGTGKRCPDTATTVHHRTYARLGNEKLDDLRAFCQHHHDLADRQRRQQKRQQVKTTHGFLRRIWRTEKHKKFRK